MKIFLIGSVLAGSALAFSIPSFSRSSGSANLPQSGFSSQGSPQFSSSPSLQKKSFKFWGSSKNQPSIGQEQSAPTTGGWVPIQDEGAQQQPSEVPPPASKKWSFPSFGKSKQPSEAEFPEAPPPASGRSFPGFGSSQQPPPPRRWSFSSFGSSQQQPSEALPSPHQQFGSQNIQPPHVQWGTPVTSSSNVSPPPPPLPNVPPSSGKVSKWQSFKLKNPFSK